MIQIKTKANPLGHIENNCKLKDAKSPNLVLVSTLKPLLSDTFGTFSSVRLIEGVHF